VAWALAQDNAMGMLQVPVWRGAASSRYRSYASGIEYDFFQH